MSIGIHPQLETKLRALAQAEGLSVEAYLDDSCALSRALRMN